MRNSGLGFLKLKAVECRKSSKQTKGLLPKDVLIFRDEYPRIEVLPLERGRQLRYTSVLLTSQWG